MFFFLFAILTQNGQKNDMSLFAQNLSKTGVFRSYKALPNCVQTHPAADLFEQSLTPLVISQVCCWRHICRSKKQPGWRRTPTATCPWWRARTAPQARTERASARPACPTTPSELLPHDFWEGTSLKSSRHKVVLRKGRGGSKIEVLKKLSSHRCGRGAGP